MKPGRCSECGQDLDDNTQDFCKDCREMQEFLSYFSEEELDDMETNIRKWVEQDCPIPAELIKP